VALGAAESVELAELTGLAKGSTEMLVGGTASTVDEGLGLAVGEAAAAATAGVGLGVGEALMGAGEVPSFTLSLRLLRESPLCA
jgi:hypothetical protein